MSFPVTCACPRREAIACALQRGGMKAFWMSLKGDEPEACECACHEEAFEDQDEDEPCEETR